MKLDETFMRLAIDMAQACTGQTHPNPMVGAVVVNDFQVVGLGSHLKAGKAHAEVHALEMAQEKANGATIYLTLEPCSHYGRTPPCVDKVIASGIKRAVIATLDPNPLVAGRGVGKLKKAGIEVEVGLFQEESQRLNEAFNHYIVHNRPFVTLKTATTLDGKIATVAGESQWITSEESRADVHVLRHQHHAILVGINTVIKDNPRLTTRLNGGKGRNPIRIILDSTLKTPLEANIVDTGEAETWIFVNQAVEKDRIEKFEQRNVRIFQTPDEGAISITHVVDILGQEQVASLLVEGGGEINASFLQGKYVDKVIAYIAPTFIGGNQAPSAFRGTGFLSLDDSIQLSDIEYTPIGRDMKVTGYVK